MGAKTEVELENVKQNTTMTLNSCAPEILCQIMYSTDQYHFILYKWFTVTADSYFNPYSISTVRSQLLNNMCSGSHLQKKQTEAWAAHRPKAQKVSPQGQGKKKHQLAV